MGDNFHTPWVDSPNPGFQTWDAASLNPTWEEFDAALTWIKNIITHFDGTLTWNKTTGELAWNDVLRIHFNNPDGEAILNTVAAGNITLSDGEFAYVELNSTDATVLTVQKAAISTGAASNFIANNLVILGYRNSASDNFFPVAFKRPWTESGGVGDVTGPAGATQDNLASYADATGKEIEDSGIAIDDVSNAIALTHIQNTDTVLDEGGPNEITAEDIAAHVFAGESEFEAQSANIIIIPEYPGALLTKSGSDNSGAMTSDQEVIANIRRNYYEWKSSEATLQSYDVSIQIPIPYNFIGFQAGTNEALKVDIKTEGNNDTDHKVDITINRDGQATTSGLSGQYTTAATWEAKGIDETDAVLAAVQAGEILNVLIRLYSKDSKYCRVGKIILAVNLK